MHKVTNAQNTPLYLGEFDVPGAGIVKLTRVEIRTECSSNSASIVYFAEVEAYKRTYSGNTPSNAMRSLMRDVNNEEKLTPKQMKFLRNNNL